MSAKPRRCGKRWLDADCPAEVLAIIRHGTKFPDYDVIFAEVTMRLVQYPGSVRAEESLHGVAINDYGVRTDHFEMLTHEVAAYRYRFKHRYARWSDLPERVKNAVRQDIAEVKTRHESRAV
jgi:hypothetical protein